MNQQILQLACRILETQFKNFPNLQDEIRGPLEDWMIDSDKNVWDSPEQIISEIIQFTMLNIRDDNYESFGECYKPRDLAKLKRWMKAHPLPLQKPIIIDRQYL